MENKHYTDKEIIDAYESSTGVWTAGRKLGISGQSIWYRLKKIGYKLKDPCKPDYKLNKIITQIYEKGFIKDDGAIEQLCKEYNLTREKISRIAGKYKLTNRKRKVSSNFKSNCSKNSKEYYKHNPNPCPNKGRKFSIETRLKVSIAMMKRWKNMTESERNKRSMKLSNFASKRLNNKSRVKCSWKQGWRTIGGRKIFFRSRWEANYGRFLEFIKNKNIIKEWYFEPETFWFKQVKRGCVSYKPDFKIINNDDSFYFVEVKGWMDNASKTKLKRMAKYYPDIKIELVRANWFKNMKSYIPLIDGWEL